MWNRKLLQLLAGVITLAAGSSAKTSGNLKISNCLRSSSVGDILYYGWFLDEEASSSLQAYSQELLGTLYVELPEAQKFFERTGKEPLEYFTKPLDPSTGGFDPFYHVTAKFCGGEIECNNYHEFVKDSLGKMFLTEIVGFFFTNSTYGARVKLSAEQKIYFDGDETVDEKEIKQSKSLMLKNKAGFPGISFQPQPLDFHPTKSRAHVTLGTAAKVPAVQTGFDLIDIVEYESKGSVNYKEFPLDVGTVRMYLDSDKGNVAFVLYPKQKLIVETEFRGYKM